MKYVLKMKLITLGSFKALEGKLKSNDPEILKACRQYGKAVAELAE